MKSPFSGVDPYMQRYWADLHITLVAAVRAALQPLLPPDLRAEIGVVAVSPRRRRSGVDDVGCDRVVRIVNRGGRDQLFTAIELLKPPNRPAGLANAAYARRVRGYERRGVNAVEIDLFRGPRVLPAAFAERPPADRPTFLIGVRRAGPSAAWQWRPFSVRDPVPAIAIPLRGGDADAPLEVQPLLDRAYRDGAYDATDYAVPPTPPLSATDEKWADALLRADGLRG